MLTRRLAFIAFLVLSLAGSALAQAKPGGGAVPAPPKDTNAPKDGDKEIAKIIAEMKKLVETKKDDDVVPKIDELVKKFETAGPKDKKSIADAIVKNLDAQRLPTEAPAGRGPKEEAEQPKIFQVSIVALSAFKELGAERLMAAYARDDYKKAKRFRGRILQMLGKTEQAGTVKFILDKLKDKDDIIVADSITALGNFTKAAEEVKKEIIDKLIKDFNSTQGQAADPSTPQGKAAKDKYDLIAPAMIDTLQKLSNQSSMRDPREWEQWWQNNKKKPLN